MAESSLSLSNLTPTQQEASAQRAAELLAEQLDERIHGHQVDDEMRAEIAEERVTAAQTSATKPAVNNAQRNGASANMSGSILQFAKSLAEVDKPVPLPAGEYTAEIRAAEVKTSENTGNQYIALTVHISADQYPADYTDGDPDGTILSYNRLSPKATPRNLWNLRNFVEALGLVAGTEVDLNDWLGKAITVGVSVQKYEGEDRAQISRIVYGA